MKALQKEKLWNRGAYLPVFISLLVALAVALLLPYLMTADRVVGFVDAGIWQLLAVSFITWILTILIVASVLKWLLENTGLPGIDHMVEHFKSLAIWERYKLYLWLFACLLASAGLTLTAVL